MLNACDKHNDVLCSCQENNSSLNSEFKPYFLSTDRTFEKSSGSLAKASVDFSSKVLSVDKKIFSSKIGPDNQIELFPVIVDVEGSLRFPENFSNHEKIITSAGLRNGAPILDKISDHVWKDEKDVIPVSGRKCSCKSVWCPVCFRYRYHDRIKEIFAPFDWQFTRQVVLTVNPDLFECPADSLIYIREHHSVGEFIRRLRRGVKIKSGCRWVYKYQPVNVVRWAWFMEFHRNGFPHFHVFVQTDGKGKGGMIGGDRLRDSWSLAKWVKETYFNSEQHFKNLTGYYADKGYFEKGKEYQGLLPDDILDKFKSKIKRMNTSERKKTEKIEVNFMNENNAEKIETPFEEANMRACEIYFDECKGLRVDKAGLDNVMGKIGEEIEKCEEPAERKKVNYRVMIQNCGEATYIELDIRDYRFEAICKLNFKKWRAKAGALYHNRRGYVVNLTKGEIIELLESVVRVTAIKKYMDVSEYCRKRSNVLEREKYDRENILMQR